MQPYLFKADPLGPIIETMDRKLSPNIIIWNVEGEVISPYHYFYALF